MQLTTTSPDEDQNSQMDNAGMPYLAEESQQVEMVGDPAGEVSNVGEIGDADVFAVQTRGPPVLSS